MAHPSSTPRPRIHDARVWRRRVRRPWNRPSDAGHVGGLLEQIPSLPRAALARVTMLMIDRMDEIDGDPDLEHLRDDDEDTHDREQEEVYE
ncbi:hypothetical protein GCM10008023_19810 [Sphingomonas glacialis]|uniref:Uncharacterized protein n=1 Tax=Sphingomonas glacialis TaxID=658225 RepID=A0ABQ3LHA1_9SPHN|nr:hypothetical protein [Sphingomonas glacialis]GHH16142.1 hypothetical protein GCM10008023_19810 [Sphingomonas glacialis]